MNPIFTAPHSRLWTPNAEGGYDLCLGSNLSPKRNSFFALGTKQDLGACSATWALLKIENTQCATPSAAPSTASVRGASVA
ncbi:MAG TPA: hypothetical protein VKP30_16335, partial [Polyangiaceae bacterium]|nr:hypothetical protein [Polyangiaceae bacterium]